MEDPTFWELPGNVGQYRDDRKNLFLDGKSNLVLRAAKEGDTYYSGKLFGKYRGPINTTWEARVKLNCLTPGCWPAWYLANNSPNNGGEVDIIEWYGNGSWAPGTTVHANLNGGEHVSHTIAPDSGWHRWRAQWTEAGISFWLDHTEGAATVLHRHARLPAQLPVQHPRLHAVSDREPCGRRIRRRRSQRRHLPGEDARRLGSRLVKP